MTSEGIKNGEKRGPKIISWCFFKNKDQEDVINQLPGTKKLKILIHL